MATEEESMGNVKRELEKVFDLALQATVPNETEVKPLVAACTAKFGDYQCNNAMGLWSKIKGKGTELKGPQAVGQAIMKNLPSSEMIESCSVAGPGFVNVVLSKNWLAKNIQKMLINGIETWAPKLKLKKAVVDFSSPNIAKEMHVGHLRSTIIGDSLARMLEFSNVEVLRRNHVGDWGTQFGMLIEYLFEEFPNLEDVNETAIGELQGFYKRSKLRFDSDPAFKERAQRAVVRLQSGEPKYHQAWAQICEISRKEFDKVYKRLRVELEEKGESFYNPYIPGVIDALSKQGLVEESQGARVIFIEGVNIPLIVVKSDGGFNYASTDLTALWYRLNEEKAEWIIYVTDVGQQQHFDMVFSAAKRAGWLPADDSSYPKASHVGFGLVLGEDGKRFRTRNTEVVRLVDLLDEAKSRSKTVLVDRGKAEEWTEEELEQTAEAVGYGAVKYADLKNNRLTNYTFNFDQMLNDKGNTAVYLLYAHARICSIIRKSGKDIEELKKEATKMVQPSSRREGFTAIPNVKWEDVGGLDYLRQEFDRYIVRRIKYPEEYEQFGVDLETGFLLYGPPGCGKTLIAKAVANDAGANFIHIKGPDFLNKYVGESELAVRTLFSRARTCSPCILFFDEVDALTTKRGKEGGWVVERLLNQLLIELDGADKRKGVFVIGATNRPDVMDRAVLRPGRFGKLLYVPLPTPDERGLILKALARKKPIDESVDLCSIAQMRGCEDLSGADLAAMMNEAAMAALEEKLTSSKSSSDATPVTIELTHFERAISKISPSVSGLQIQRYKTLSATFKAA